MTALETDVVVVGVGSVGSMASWQIASRGLRVIGVDRFSIPGPLLCLRRGIAHFPQSIRGRRALHTHLAKGTRSVA